jgi:hypothetical protein
MFWHDFGQVGRGAIVAIVSHDRGRMRIILHVACINNNKYLGKKHLRKMGDLFKHPGFLEPACDGQHGYRVLLVSVVKKNICF